jgi:hypothetical protein
MRTRFVSLLLFFLFFLYLIIIFPFSMALRYLTQPIFGT